MTDIIDRLRDEASELHEEAAALIERLRAEKLELEAELALRRGTIAGNQWDGPASGFHIEYETPSKA